MGLAMISADNFFAMGAILFGLAAFGFWMDNQALGKKTSGVIWVLLAGMALSNFKIIPLDASIYGFVGGTLVPLAVPLLLFKANLRKIFSGSGMVMITFCIASIATVAGAISGFYILELGDIGPKVAGVYSGAWIGGMVNFLAVSQAVEMTTDEFSAALSASAVVSILALMMLLWIPTIKWVVSKFPSGVLGDEAAGKREELCLDDAPRIKLVDLSGAIALSFAICAVSKLIAEALSMTSYLYLFITLLSVIAANVFSRALSDSEGDFEIGMLIMYLFFAVAGANTNVTAFIESSLHLFFYGMIIIVVHLAVVLIAARMFRISLPEAIVASGAALVGPAVTAAIATSKGWKHLVTPAIMCGLFGYVIGTFIGVTVTGFLR